MQQRIHSRQPSRWNNWNETRDTEKKNIWPHVDTVFALTECGCVRLGVPCRWDRPAERTESAKVWIVGGPSPFEHLQAGDPGSGPVVVLPAARKTAARAAAAATPAGCLCGSVGKVLTMGRRLAIIARFPHTSLWHPFQMGSNGSVI